MFREFIRDEIQNLVKKFWNIFAELLHLYGVAVRISLGLTAILIPIAVLFGSLSGWWLVLEVALIVLFFYGRRYRRYCEEHREDADEDEDTEE